MPAGSEATPSRVVYDIPQAMEFTGLGRTTLLQAIKKGQLTRIKVGRRVLLAHDDLLTWLRRHRQVA